MKPTHGGANGVPGSTTRTHDAYHRNTGTQRPALQGRRGADRNQPAGTRKTPHHLARIFVDGAQPHGLLPLRNDLGRVRLPGQPRRELPPHAPYPQGQPRGHPAHELPRMAPDLLRRAEERRNGRAPQFPLHRRGDQILHRARRHRRAHLRPVVHRPRGIHLRAHPAREGAHLRRRGLPVVRRALQPRFLLLQQIPGDPALRRGGRRHLLLLRHHRLPEGHRAPSPQPHARLHRGAEAPRPDP